MYFDNYCYNNNNYCIDMQVVMVLGIQVAVKNCPIMNLPMSLYVSVIILQILLVSWYVLGTFQIFCSCNQFS